MAKVFISSTSRDLKSYRDVVAKWATENGHEAVFQEKLPVRSDQWTISQLLREQLDSCDAVIHLAGLFYGVEPTNRPAGTSRLSYTQLEFELAKLHERQVVRFIARPGYEPDNQYSQSEEEAGLQQQHRLRLMEGDTPYHKFSSRDELRSLLSEIDIKSTLRKPQNLPVVGSLFKGRDDFIEQLRSVLVKKPTHSASVTGKLAIHGLGGVGKTRVAVQYARQFQHDYTALLYVTADSPANLDRNLANLCGALVLNLPEQQEPKQERQVAAAVRWLRENSGWLLIIDNVDTPEAAEATEELLKRLKTGHIVVTSRLSEWGHALEELSLDVITEGAATEFLLERTNLKRKPEPTDRDDALSLAKDLGQLPLALEQAGAFIVRHRGSLKEYNVRWKRHESKVLKWHDQRTMKYRASVATTWQTSVDQLSNDGRALLNVLCWLAPAPIPLTMIKVLPSWVPTHEGLFHAIPNLVRKFVIVDSSKRNVDTERGMSELIAYSLADRSPTDGSVSLHRVVSEIARVKIAQNKASNWLLRALHMSTEFMASGSCGDPRDWSEKYDPLATHLDRLLSHAADKRIYSPTARLMDGLAGYLKGRGDLNAAERLRRQVVKLDEIFLPGTHPDFATSLTNLASCLIDQRKFSEAEALAQRAVAINLNCFGPIHLQTARSSMCLAVIYLRTGRLDEAGGMMQECLETAELLTDTDFSDLFVFTRNYATALMDSKRLEDASMLLEYCLKTFGGHEEIVPTDVAVALQNLAECRERLAMPPARSERLLREALGIHRRWLGPSHLNVATTMTQLAELLNCQRKIEEAKQLAGEALQIFERVNQSHGSSHPSTAYAQQLFTKLCRESDTVNNASRSKGNSK